MDIPFLDDITMTELENLVDEMKHENDLKAENEGDEQDMNSRLFNDKNNPLQKNKKEYTPLDQYKPTGNLVYNQEMFEKIDKKMH